MKNLKIKVLVALFMLISVAYARVYIPKNYRVSFDRLSADSIKTFDLDVVLRKYVPSKYVNAFMYYTEGKSENDTLNLRIQILALGSLETGWRPLVGKMNKNGSVDKGYLQLNNYNIRDKWFMNRFGPSDKDLYKYDTEDEEELYLITCIKFYKALRSIYGDDAAYCYNCGEMRYRRGQIPQSTYNYKKKMSSYVTEIISEINYVKEKRTELENLSAKTINVRYNFVNEGWLIQYNIRDQQNNEIITYEFIRILKKNDKEDIFQILKRYTRPNKKYTFVGYIKRTGVRTPVFKNNKTKALIVC